MWVIANDYEKPEQKVLVSIEDFVEGQPEELFECLFEEVVIEELDRRFGELFDYDPEGYDWVELSAEQLPDHLTMEMLNENNYYYWEVK